jgi:hypothetical protein
MMTTVAPAESLHVGTVTSDGFDSANDQLYGMTSFAAQHIQSAKKIKNLSSLSVTLNLDSDLGEQAYRIKCQNKNITVTGGDARGVLYGGLELAERIRLEILNDADTIEGKPYLAKRGIKINIPLDARLPSYADSGDAAQHNIAEMWNWNFWTEFLDNMALHRYNTLTLWNPHPFPSMTKVPGYEDVALEDVAVCTLDLKTQKYLWGPVQMVSQEVMDNLKTVKTMTIEQKIHFWRKVMSYAKDRGIDIFFITWNICPNSVARPVAPGYKSWSAKRQDEAPGKYGISHQINNQKTIEYYRQSVKSFILTYPDLKGLGVAAGEHMPPDRGGALYTREKWLWEAYGRGIMAAKMFQPDREVHVIHRAIYSSVDKMIKHWGRYPDPFELSFKYARARLYSGIKPPFANGLIERIKPLGLKSWWNLRNDDIFYLRWGGPDYVRDFLENFPEGVTAGYHMGSDGYVWGREFVTQEGDQAGALEITKHWYKFMLWGRLGYDPTLGRDFFQKVLHDRFSNAQVMALYDAWQQASKVIPLVNRFHWRDWDFMWAVEGCKDGKYRTVLDFYDNPTMENSGILNVKAYVQAVQTKKDITQTTPLDIADQLEIYAQKSLSLLISIDAGKGTELETTLLDIKAMAFLGQFYAQKIRATVALGFFKQTGKQHYHQEAVDFLMAGLVPWSAYTSLNQTRYKSQILARTGLLDWTQLQRDAEQEIRLVLKMKSNER